MKAQPVQPETITLTPEQREAVAQNGSYENAMLRIRVDGELLHIQLIGPRDLGSIVRCCRICEEVQRRHGRLFLLIVDDYGMSPMPPECRAFLGQWNRSNSVDALAMVSTGNRLFKTVVELLVRAFNLTRPQPMELSFFAREPEARAWLEERRQRKR